MKTAHARSLQLLALVTFAWMLTMTGCIPGGESNNEEASGPLTPERFVEEYQQLYGEAFCRSAYQCPKEQSQYVLYIASIFEDEPSCRQRLGRDITKYNFPRAAQFELWTYESDLAEFDADAARACLDEIEANTSADACMSIYGVFTIPPSCYDVARGVQPEDEPCGSDAHCQSGYCDGSLLENEDGCPLGRCAADTRSAPGVQSSGEPCTVIDRQICDLSEGLTCDTTPELDEQRCVRPDQAPRGSDCRTSAVCEEGLSCTNPGDEAFCLETELNAEGDACALGDCQPGLVCANTGRDRGPYYTCELPAALGEPCYNSFECQWDLYCEGEAAASDVEGECAPRLTEGASCRSRLQCDTGLTCTNDTCVPTGEACGIAPAQ